MLLIWLLPSGIKVFSKVQQLLEFNVCVVLLTASVTMMFALSVGPRLVIVSETVRFHEQVSRDNSSARTF